MGRVAISVYTLITKILKHKLDAQYTSYEKEFRETIKKYLKDEE